jgi:hypothetical protein
VIPAATPLLSLYKVVRARKPFRVIQTTRAESGGINALSSILLVERCTETFDFILELSVQRIVLIGFLRQIP